jgi:hypothetical protein
MRYVIALLDVVPATVPVATGDGSRARTPELVAMPIIPFNVKVFLTKTRNPFVFRNEPNGTVRLL